MQRRKRWFALCFGAMLVLARAGIAGTTVYFEDWESGNGGWVAKMGDGIDLQSGGVPPGLWTQRITQTNLNGYYYYSPLIQVTPSETYELSVWINWVDGGWPGVGIERYSQTSSDLATNCLIGAPGLETGLSPGDTETVVAIADGWQEYTKVFTMPSDTYYIRLLDKLWGWGGRDGDKPYSYARAGGEGYFDAVTLSTVPVPAAVVLAGIGVLGATRFGRRSRL